MIFLIKCYDLKKKKKKQSLSCSLLPFLIVKCCRFASQKYLHHNYLKKRDPRLIHFVLIFLPRLDPKMVSSIIFDTLLQLICENYISNGNQSELLSPLLGHYFLASSVLHTFPFNFYSFFTGWMNIAGIWRKKKHSTPHTIFNMKSVDISIEKIGLTNFSSLS